MAASTEPVNITTFKAGGTIRKFRFVTLSGAGEVSESGANGRAIGISQNAASVSSGELVEIALSGGGAKLEIGETVAQGKILTSTSTGTGEVVDAAAEWSGAICIEAGVSGDIIGVRVHGFQAHATDA
jgi:hypothetical protein